MREEEAYRYEQQLERKRVVDERENERLMHERKDEEQEIKDTLMTELSELRKKAAAAPVEIERAVKQAIATAVAQTQSDAATKASFAKQQADAALNLATVRITSLEETVKTQLQEIFLLKKQLDEATRQVKDIAVSVIASNRVEQPSSVSAK